MHTTRAQSWTTLHSIVCRPSCATRYLQASCLRSPSTRLVLSDSPQEITLNLTPWQVPKLQRLPQPNKNVTQPDSYTLTQICKKIRSETLKLFYFTNTLVLEMSDFESHTSPILAPPLASATKLHHLHNLVGSEVVHSVRKGNINLQQHYLRSYSAFGLDPKASANLREIFYPSTTLNFFISIHLPIPKDSRIKKASLSPDFKSNGQPANLPLIGSSAW